MTKFYVSPTGKRLKSIPRFIVLKSKRTMSLPKEYSDADWKKIPGCAIIEVP